MAALLLKDEGLPRVADGRIGAVWAQDLEPDGQCLVVELQRLVVLTLVGVADGLPVVADGQVGKRLKRQAIQGLIEPAPHRAPHQALYRHGFAPAPHRALHQDLFRHGFEPAPHVRDVTRFRRGFEPAPHRAPRRAIPPLEQSGERWPAFFRAMPKVAWFLCQRGEGYPAVPSYLCRGVLEGIHFTLYGSQHHLSVTPQLFGAMPKIAWFLCQRGECYLAVRSQLCRGVLEGIHFTNLYGSQQHLSVTPQLFGAMPKIA
mmetsp:Transcript_123045/g.319957  ORF Transcript_123045/g.319957 Transcript_123045/m.319957 type:complete len:259 (-) Transcript_123045:24-800(-)